jgi:hypothetical protein
MLLQNAIVDTLNNSEWAFPLAECVHIGGFAIGVGSIALVDFRLLNLGLRDATPAQVLRSTEPWTLIRMSPGRFRQWELNAAIPSLKCRVAGQSGR